MPTIQELQNASQNQSEDFLRFQEGDAQRWSPYYDAAASAAAGRPQFRSSRGAPGMFDKPTECPPGQVPSGPNETDPCRERGGGGGGGRGGGGGGQGGGGNATGQLGAAPQFSYDKFQAPTWEQAMSDPGYQAALQQGNKTLQNSQAAQGVLRTGGSLQDLLNYNQDMAAQQYQNVYNRAANTYGINFNTAQAEFAPQYGAWQTQYGGNLQKDLQGNQLGYNRWATRYGGDLQKYLQNEQNIYGLLNSPPPTPYGY